MDDDRRCIQCGDPLGSNRRPEAVFCRGQKCKRRYYRRQQGSHYDPPSPGTSSVAAESRADARFRAALASHQEASQPLTDYEEALLLRQRRNPGPMLVELQARMLAREYDRQAAEAEEYSRHDPIRVQDPLDPSTRDHLRRRAIQSRSRQGKPVDPSLRALRPPVDPGHGPWDDTPECITAPWSRSRW